MHGNVRDWFVLRSNDRSHCNLHHHCRRRKADELMTDCKIQEVKEYLRRVRYQKGVVNSLNEHLEQLRMEIYSVEG